MPFELMGKDPSPNKQDLSFAQRLNEGLTLHRNTVKSPFRPKKWSEYFTKLRKKYSAEIIDQVLTWYLSELPFLKEKKIVRANGARQFCSHEKFPRLFERMVDDLKKNPVVVVSKEAKSMAAGLDHFRWPNNVGPTVPAFIQQCLDAYRKFYKQLNTISTHDPTLTRIIHHFLMDKLILTEVRNWVKNVYERIKNVEWKGSSLESWVFSPHHRVFKEKMATEFKNPGSKAKWDQIMEKLKTLP